MEKSNLRVRCLPCWAKTGDGFKQTLEWIALSDEVPPKEETVLVATEQSLALGYITHEGNLVIEHMPWDQEEYEEDEPKFLYWMPLPHPPVWLINRGERDLKKTVRIQLRLWE